MTDNGPVPGTPSAEDAAEIALGTAREAYDHALVFGDESEVAATHTAVAVAREALAAASHASHSDFVAEQLRRLDAGSTVMGMVARAAAGFVLNADLVEAYENDADHLDLSAAERAFVRPDLRRLRGVVLARRENRPLAEVADDVRAAESEQLAHAARSQGPDDGRLSAWVAAYVASEGLDDGTR